MKITQDNTPSITLLSHTPLSICANGIRTCYQSFGKSDTKDPCTDSIGEKDKELIHRVGNKFKHSSTLEHLNYSFFIDGISRACLQELARHRHASLSVESTRYTLQRVLKNLESISIEQEQDILANQADDLDEASRLFAKYQQTFGAFLVFTADIPTDLLSIIALNRLKKLMIDYKTPNDKAKFCLPESYKTALTWTLNARSLQNFLELRSKKEAMWEIRRLANAIYDSLPQEHQYLFEHCMQEIRTKS